MAIKETKAKTGNKGKEKRGKSGTVATPLVRFSFPYVYKMDIGNENSSEKYKITGIIEKDREAELKPLKQACMVAAKQIWPKIKYKELETPFNDGDESNTEAHQGHIIFTAKTTRKPTVVGPDKLPLAEGNEVYGGCYGKFSVVASTYNRVAEAYIEKADGTTKKTKKPIKGVNFFLNNVQFIKDGERFGGGTSADQDFDEVDPAEYDDVGEDENFEEDGIETTEGAGEEEGEEEDDDELM